MAVRSSLLLPPLLIAGILVIPAIGARGVAHAQEPPPGTLSITAPESSSLSSGTPTDAGALSAALGSITVHDARGQIGATWTATVSTTSFTTGAATAYETLGRENVAYWSGPAVSSTGTGVFTPGQVTEDVRVSLDVPRTAFTMASGIGNNSVSWEPTVVVTIPSSAVTGTYTGTITHSVA